MANACYKVGSEQPEPFLTVAAIVEVVRRCTGLPLGSITAGSADEGATEV